MPEAISAALPPSHSFLILFSKALITRTIVGSVVLVAINTVIYGFIAWIPTLLVKQGLSVVSSLGFTTLMSLGGPVGALIGMWLGDRIGRKRGIVAFSIVAILLGILYPYSNDPMFLAIVGFGLVTALYILVALAFALYIPELFPTEVRMRGAGFCNTVGACYDDRYALHGGGDLRRIWDRRCGRADGCLPNRRDSRGLVPRNRD